VYHELHAAKWTDEDIAECFELLSPWMYAPVRDDSPWVAEVPNEIFFGRASAPKARRQDLTELTSSRS
jgi:hypothetical protein